jgi:hypothetical protein
MYRQKLFQQVIGVTLIVVLFWCSSPATTPEAIIDTPIPSTATPLPPILTPTLIPPTQTPLSPLMTIQNGNNLPRTLLQTKTSPELADNQIGGTVMNFWLNLEFGNFPNIEMANHGFKRARVTINEPDSYLVRWDTPEDYIKPNYNEFITNLAQNHIRIIYDLIYWDKAYHNAGGEVGSPRFKTEDEIQRYFDYVRFVIRNFGDRVQYYEIWNEPNFKNSIMNIDVADYIDLTRRTIAVIREEEPEAKIVVGSVHIHDSESLGYLSTILKSDLMPMVDVIAWHPMIGLIPGKSECNGDFYYEYPPIVQEIKSLANTNGFTGEFTADELHWQTPKTNPNSACTCSEQVSAKYYARGILMHLGMDVSVGLVLDTDDQPVAFSLVRNISTIMAGANPINLSVEVQGEASNIKTYGFSLPNGDRLVALWTDGLAVDDDPGIASTLTIPGFSNWNAVGMDVLNGFEQKLIISNENGNLIIRDLLIKDYPIVIRLSK